MMTMSEVPKTFLTEQEYLAIERRADFRSEYYRGEMFAMAGSRYEHTRIKDNVSCLLASALEKTSCFPLTSDMRVHIPATTLYTYPDVVVVCGNPEFQDQQHDVLLNPHVIIEVLSESTEKYDRGAKFQQYQHLTSLREYILVAQDEARVERYVRQPNNDWLLTNFVGLDASVTVQSVQATIPLLQVYEGVELKNPQAAAPEERPIGSKG